MPANHSRKAAGGRQIRSVEVLAVLVAVWGEIDWKMKTKEDFECPLSDAAVAILNTIKGDDEPAPNAPIFTGVIA